MRIALIDVDGHNFPNLPLMKLSAWHKQNGDQVEWYDPLTAWLNPPDRVYMSKVFTFTPDYLHPVCAGEIIKGGTGYEYPSGGKPLPEESGFYMASVYCEVTKESHCRNVWFTFDDDPYAEMEWRELPSYEKVVAWMPLPEPYKGE